jgi:hypothetical protein
VKSRRLIISPRGIHFEKILDRLGIAKEIKAKSILNAKAATTPNAEIVARGEAELGIQLISEIVSVPGAELLGPLPAELQAIRDFGRNYHHRDRPGRCKSVVQIPDLACRRNCH